MNDRKYLELVEQQKLIEPRFRKICSTSKHLSNTVLAAAKLSEHNLPDIDTLAAKANEEGLEAQIAFLKKHDGNEMTRSWRKFLGEHLQVGMAVSITVPLGKYSEHEDAFSGSVSKISPFGITVVDSKENEYPVYECEIMDFKIPCEQH